jgi:hypothetical protein
VGRLPDKITVAVAVAVVEFVYGAPADNPRQVGRPLRWGSKGAHARSPHRHIDSQGHRSMTTTSR